MPLMKSYSLKTRQASGFTLIEIMVVIAEYRLGKPSRRRFEVDFYFDPLSKA